MSLNDNPLRRRALVTLTAAVTAVVTVAGLGFLGLTATPSAGTQSADSPTTGPAAGTGTTGPDVPAPVGTPAPSGSAAASSAPSTAPTLTGSLSDVKNVVLILADDLDWELFKQVPRLAALQDAGMTFTNHTVTDSLCCPSRASILRGQYIHNHLVVSNSSKTGGGWPTFRQRGEHRDCLPVWLDNAGATTGLFGKYLNEYPGSRNPRIARYVPPGWDQWGVPVSHGDSYTGYNYRLNDNGRLVSYGNKPADFLNDVITQKATDFIRTSPEGFFLQLATYTPHNPAPVAARNKGTHPTSIAPRNPNYNAVGTNEPSWLKRQPVIEPWRQARLDLMWRKRAESAESVADSVDAVRSTLQATGHADDTLIIVTSDNGYHIGAHRLPYGKRTAFREDTVVPMVVMGPGITPGVRINAMTSTIDLAPTITSLLGAPAPSWLDGRSLTDILSTGQVPPTWRKATLSESLGLSTPEDPDYQPDAPPQFTALRTPQWLFVVYRDGERELYDLTADPYEMNNIASTADPRLVADLYSQLQALRACAGETCRTADAIVLPGDAPTS